MWLKDHICRIILRTEMALLHRFLRLNDSPGGGETGVFTFIVTRAVVRADEDSNVTTKDFT